MSQSWSQTPTGGKTVRERRRQSADLPLPYKKPRTPAAAMPATRRSPGHHQIDIDDPEPTVPLAGIMQELALLRRSMEAKFSEASDRSTALRNEVVRKLEANDRAVSELQIAVTDVTLSVDQNQLSTRSAPR